MFYYPGAILVGKTFTPLYVYLKYVSFILCFLPFPYKDIKKVSFFPFSATFFATFLF